MKVTDKQKKEVVKYIKKWKGILFLNIWRIDTYYVDDDSVEFVEIKMSPEYKNATILIRSDKFFENTKNSIEREEIISHELCHCIVQPLVNISCQAAMGRQVTQEEIDWFKEEVTQHFTRAIFYKK